MKNALRQSFYILGIAVVSFGFFGIHLALGATVFDLEGAQSGHGRGSNTAFSATSTETASGTLYYSYCVHNFNTQVAGAQPFTSEILGAPPIGTSYGIDNNPVSPLPSVSGQQVCQTGTYTTQNGGIVNGTGYDFYVGNLGGGNNAGAGMSAGDYWRVYDTPIPSTSQTYIRLVYPINGTTTPYFTTPNNFNPVLEYYWGSTLGSTSPSLVQISVTPVSSSFFGLTKPSPINLYVNFGGSNIVQTITGSLDEASSSLQQGQYTWKASLIATTTTDLNSYCVSVLFWLCTHGVATSTLISSNSATFQVGNGGQFSTTTDKGNTTSSILDYCQDYSGSDGIVKALCFIPNSISAIVTTIFVPPQGTVDADFSVIQNDFNTTLTIWPVGYMTRFVSILSATSTATSSLPTIAYTFPTSTPFLGGVEWDLNPWQYFYEGGSWISSLKSAGAKPEDVWTIFEPVINMILIIVLLYEIIHDLSGFRHHERDFSSHENKSGIIKGK